MKAIYKYRLDGCRPVQALPLEPDARLVHAGMQDERVTLWFEVDPHAEDISSNDYKIVGTGMEWDETHWEHVATVEDGAFIWHILQFRKLSSK